MTSDLFFVKNAQIFTKLFGTATIFSYICTQIGMNEQERQAY